MRVLLTTDTIGGVWTFTRELTEGLLAEGHAVALVSFGRAPGGEQRAWVKGVLAEFAGRFAYEASPTPLEWMQNNAEAFTGAAAALRARVRSFRPDILHSNQFCFGSLSIDIPKLITAHSDVLSWGAACRPDGLDASPWLTRYVALVQQGIDGADAVVAPTGAMLRSLSDHFRVHCQTGVIANGRRLALTDSIELRRRQAVSVGRLWDEGKGLAMLLAMRSPVPVLLAGEERFEAASTAAGAARVKALGVLGEDALHDLFRRSSVYLVPSLYEPFGLAPLEAALCGCAVVARDLDSLREVWGEAATYFRTPAECEQALRRLFASPRLLRTAQAAARHRAETFTRARMTTAYTALYAEMIEPAAPRGVVEGEFAAHAA